MAFEQYWNNDHAIRENDEIVYDGWLDQYLDIINNTKTTIVDLGCGLGNNALYLSEKGFKVLACDYAEEAIKYLNKKLPMVETLLFDMEEGLPFEDESYDLIVADLSLHYFNKETSINIMKDIKRVLTKNGTLLARVNHYQDVNYGSTSLNVLEENYYFTQGYNKRFFNDKDIEKYFGLIGEVTYHTGEMHRYAHPKVCYEVCARKE